MTSVSITLLGRLVSDSKKFAERLGISRSEFIRIAVKHEVARLEKQLKLQSMAKSFQAMRKNERYLAESKELDLGFSDKIKGDEDDWWR